MTSIYTFTALRRMSVRDLHALYRETHLQAGQSAPGSRDRQTAIANLDTIQRVLNEHRRPSGPSP